MPGWLTLKLGVMIAGGLAVAIFIGLAFHWKAQAADRKAELETICAATRSASGQPRLKCDQVAQQIGFMGETIGTLSSAIKRQNALITAMGAETERQQGESERASRIAQERSGRAEATSGRLAASARAGDAQARPCEPSKALQENWR